MDLRQLRTFSCVAELGSLSKASDTLRVAQPALSRQIKLLEHELRAELFTRNGRGMVLTDAGRLLLARTAGIVRQIDQVRDEIQSAGGPPSGRVVLGLVPTVSCVISARLARRTVDKYPGISLCIVESYSGHLMEWLHRGEMDLALIYGPSSDLHLTVQSLGRDTIVAVGPRGSGLAQKKQVDIGWLLRQRLVLPSHSHGLRALIEHAAAKKKLKLDVKLEADSFRVLTSLVEEGLGYTLLPPSSVRNEVAAGTFRLRGRHGGDVCARPAPACGELTLASPHHDISGSKPAITLITKLIRDEAPSALAPMTAGLRDIRLGRSRRIQPRRLPIGIPRESNHAASSALQFSSGYSCHAAIAIGQAPQRTAPTPPERSSPDSRDSISSVTVRLRVTGLLHLPIVTSSKNRLIRSSARR